MSKVFMKNDYWRACGEMIMAGLKDNNRVEAAKTFQEYLPAFESLFAKVTIAGKFKSGAELSTYVAQASAMLGAKIGANISAEYTGSGKPMDAVMAQAMTEELAEQLPPFFVKTVLSIAPQLKITKEEKYALEMYSEIIGAQMLEQDPEAGAKMMRDVSMTLFKVMIDGPEKRKKSNHLKLLN